MRIRKKIGELTDDDFQWCFTCPKDYATRILQFVGIAQLGYWNSDVLATLFHPYMYADKNLVCTHISEAQKAGRLPEQFTPDVAMKWLETEGVTTDGGPEWVRANHGRVVLVCDEAPVIQEPVEVSDSTLLSDRLRAAISQSPALSDSWDFSGPVPNYPVSPKALADPSTPSTQPPAAPVVEPSQFLPRQTRRNLLTPLIEGAQLQCKDPTDAAAVWLVLTLQAERKVKPFVGVTEGGLQWIDQNDEPQFLSLKNLRDRIKRKPKRPH